MSRVINPYNFVPVSGRAERKKIIRHDKFPRENLLSGRIECTGYALTPIIVGNKQTGPEHGHKTLHPFRFPDGTIGIPRAALQGAISNVYAAYTNSPMERLQDRTFSFRPNLKHPVGSRASFGLVVNVTPEEILILEIPLSELVFSEKTVPRNGYQYLGEWLTELYKWWNELNEQTTASVPPLPLPSLIQRQVRYRTNNHVNRESNDGELLQNVIQLQACGGLDGDNLFAQKFAENNNRSFRWKRSVFISMETLREAIQQDHFFTLSMLADENQDNVRRFYELSQEHLKSKEGHFNTDHPNLPDKSKVEASLTRNRGSLKMGNTIFYEIRNNCIYSFGRSYYYRFRNMNSIKYKNKDLPNQEIRSMFDLREEQGKHIDEVELSARRRLFGFADESPEDISGNTPDDILKSLAGRVRFSYARHKSGSGCEKKDVPLKILGSPRPSAYEYYLTQDDQSPLRDWGDMRNAGRSGESRGRKFYLHNPNAAWDKSCYEMKRADWPESDNTSFPCHKMNQTVETLLAPREDGPADINRFPIFTFNVIFTNLEAQELDKLILSIGLCNDRHIIQTCLSGAGPLQNNPVFSKDLKAHKIGHGQPLGLGSFLVTVDKLKYLSIDHNGHPVLTEKEVPRNTDPWKNHDELGILLSVKQFKFPVTYRKFTVTRKDGKSTRTIFNFHSRVRQLQAKARFGEPFNAGKVVLPIPERMDEGMDEDDTP
jgi:CRISPR-associated protein (TIGR03986 family)